MKKLICAIFCAIGLAGCGADDAKVASHNLSKAADNFEVYRRVVFYNSITGEFMLSIEGFCSIGKANEADAVTVTCKTGEGKDVYKKHFLGLSDNVTYFAEQLTSADVSKSRYRVTFKPVSIIPDVDIRN